jgi:putative inorganic carbon (hco3(-)) transporter
MSFASRLPAQLRSRDVALAALVLGLTGSLYFLPFPLQMTVLAALTMIGVFHPRSLIFAVPAAVGFVYQPIGFDRLIFNPVEVLVAIAVVATAVNLMVSRRTRRLSDAPYETRALRNVLHDHFALGLAAAMLAIGMMSLLTVADPDHLRESARQFRWVVVIPVVYYLLAVSLVRDPPGRWTIAASLVAGGAVAASIAILMSITGGGIVADSVVRAVGLAPHPNALALYLERVVAFGIVLAFITNRRRTLWWSVPSTIVLVALAMTLSRGAILATSVAVVAVFLLAGYRQHAVVAAGATIFGGITLAVIAPERLLRLFDGGSGSLRLELWGSSVAMIRDHWLTGVGLDQFLYQYLPRYVQPSAWPERFTAHPHQIVLDIWLNLGIMGLLFAAAYGLFVYRRVIDAAQMHDELRLAAVAGLVAGLIHGVIDNSYFLPDLAILFWIFTAILAGDGHDREHARSPVRA